MEQWIQTKEELWQLQSVNLKSLSLQFLFESMPHTFQQLRHAGIYSFYIFYCVNNIQYLKFE
jgi:hypothetical protein